MQEIRSKRRRNPEVWHKANRFILVLIVLGFIGVALFAFLPEISRHKNLASQLEREREALAREELVKRQRLREVNLLQHDPEYVEIIARDRLGVMKEGETIFRLDSPTNAPASSGTNSKSTNR